MFRHASHHLRSAKDSPENVAGSKESTEYGRRKITLQNCGIITAEYNATQRLMCRILRLASKEGVIFRAAAAAELR